MADTTSSGISFLGALALIFIVLKLTGNVAWGWFWVLSPVILPWGLALAVVAIIGIIKAIGAVAVWRRQRRQLDDAFRNK